MVLAHLGEPEGEARERVLEPNARKAPVEEEEIELSDDVLGRESCVG